MHPNEVQLALYAGRDLPVLERWRISRHVRGCAGCESILESFDCARNELRGNANRLPENLNWDRLAAEMTGNIRVGLAAGECIAAIGPRKDRLGWPAAAVLATASLLITSAWWLNIPPRAKATGVVLEATQSGIELKQNGGSLMILNRKSDSKPIYGSTPGSLRVRYVDAETNQVTINNVYAQ